MTRFQELRIAVHARKRRFANAAELERLQGEGVRLQGAITACWQSANATPMPVLSLPRGNCGQVLACFNGHPISAAEIAFRTQLGRNRVRHSIWTLRRDKKIKAVARGLYVKTFAGHSDKTQL